MKMLLRNFFLYFGRPLTVGIFFCSFVLLAPQYVNAQKITYENNKEGVSKRIEKNLKKTVIPTSNSLSYSLARVLPEVDGKRFPLSLSIEPTVPVNPEGSMQVVFRCQWGARICRPFFAACAALVIQCTD